MGVMTIGPDDERPVDLADDDLEILPDQTSDDTDAGRYDDDRPPHW